MPEIKVTLGIGYPSATHEDVLDIDDDDWAACETEEERNKLMDEYLAEWAGNYIEMWAELVTK